MGIGVRIFSKKKFRFFRIFLEYIGYKMDYKIRENYFWYLGIGKKRFGHIFLSKILRFIHACVEK